MSHSAEWHFRKDALVGRGTRLKPRINTIPALMITVIAIMVALALIAEARMTPEQRLALFESSYAYP